ncbi:ABC transporter permease [Streptomonospora sp. S1-112]|uniref:ABC transporter permease n=1 Tax=Streptomonospora mangrovi TaxID=2883123 RepID=A0A9X3NRM8_9ACTN|nr:ABC transporter permease [Streptomonospora mangrovi]MDA0567910.1 ABC transporter permease [Streptomonospora mangrovi]
MTTSTGSGPAAAARGAGARGAADADQGRGGGFAGSVAAEWTKLWSLRSTWTCLATAVLLTAGPAALGATVLESGGQVANMTAHGMLPTVVMLSQFALVAVASLIITGEYATGAVRTTLTAVPVRGRVLAAKALVLVAAVFPVGLALGGVSIGISTVVFGDAMVFEAEHVAHAVLGTAGYLTAVSLFALGLGTALRSTAGTITATVGVLIGVPMFSTMLNNETILEIASYLPADAGLPLMMGSTDPYGWPAGAALLGAWAAAALAAGYAALRLRDA